MNIIDFTDFQLSDRNLEYAGRAGEKRGIVYKNERWFLKFPKNTIGMSGVTGLSYVTSPLNEFIGSQIYRILGYDVHETVLGVCNDGRKDKVVCACKDFIGDDTNEILIPYTALRNDSNPLVMEKNDDSRVSPSNFGEIVFQLEHNDILRKIDGAKKRFFDVLIIDMLINNNDRNEDNWGVIKYKNENKYKMAPVFDCGNSFYGKTSEERIKIILADSEMLRSSSLNGTTAYDDDEGNRIHNIEILDVPDQDLKEAVIRVYENVAPKLEEIATFINEIPNSFKHSEIISEARKEYYIKTFTLRLMEILKPKYESLKRP